MKLILILAAACLASDLLVLSNKNFDTEITKQNHLLVAFYKNDCKKCIMTL